MSTSSNNSNGASNSSTSSSALQSGDGISPPPPKRPAIFSPPYPNVGLSPDPSTSSARDLHRTTPTPHDDEWKNIHVVRSRFCGNILSFLKDKKIFHEMNVFLCRN